MTHHTDAERAEFEAWFDAWRRSTWHPLPSDIAKGKAEMPMHWNENARQDMQIAWKAARRAPAAPVPQGWKLVPVEPTDEMIAQACKDHGYPGGSRWVYRDGYRSMLAAAPQPPEAAPVQLPCVERIDVLDVAKELKENISAFGDTKCKAKEKAAFYLVSQHEQILYWQQQVRELLAAHGIKVAP